MANQPLISVIVPVYNAEEYLRQCVESVLAQTYSNWELILVDDGSTDYSGKMCDLAACSSARIKVRHTKNRGVSAARNTGLDMMRGRYVAFLDADDMLHPQFLETALDKLLKADADVVQIKSRLFEDGDIKVFNRLAPYPEGIFRINPIVYSPVEACTMVLYQNKIDPSPWGKLFKESLWREARFRESSRYEDLDLIPMVLRSAACVAYFPVNLYFYRQHGQSFLHTFSLGRADVLDVTQRLVDSFAGEPALHRAALDRQLSANFNILALIEANRAGIKEGEKEEVGRIALSCWQKIKELRGKSLRNPHVRLKNKLGIIVSYLGGRRLIGVLSRL